MVITQETGIPCIEEIDASGEVSLLYDEIKSTLQSPNVPNSIKAIGVSVPVLTIYWTLNKAYMEHLTLPNSLVSMIMYTIAKNNQCAYCSAHHEVSCRALGIDDETLTALVEDLGNVSPERIRAIIEFALKVAKNPQGLVRADYDNVRQHGITNSELVEIILVAANAVFNDTLADGLKIGVESEIVNALAG